MGLFPIKETRTTHAGARAAASGGTTDTATARLTAMAAASLPVITTTGELTATRSAELRTTARGAAAAYGTAG